MEPKLAIIGAISGLERLEIITSSGKRAVVTSMAKNT